MAKKKKKEIQNEAQNEIDEERKAVKENKSLDPAISRFINSSGIPQSIVEGLISSGGGGGTPPDYEDVKEQVLLNQASIEILQDAFEGVDSKVDYIQSESFLIENSITYHQPNITIPATTLTELPLSFLSAYTGYLKANLSGVVEKSTGGVMIYSIGISKDGGTSFLQGTYREIEVSANDIFFSVDFEGNVLAGEEFKAFVYATAAGLIKSGNPNAVFSGITGNSLTLRTSLKRALPEPTREEAEE